MIHDFPGTTVFVCQADHIRFRVSWRNHGYRPHMLGNYFFFHLVQMKIFAGISIGSDRMGDGVQPVSRLFAVFSPVIQKQIVEHAASRRRAGIQTQFFADFIIIVCYIQTVFITIGIAVLIVLFSFPEQPDD